MRRFGDRFKRRLVVATHNMMDGHGGIRGLCDRYTAFANSRHGPPAVLCLQEDRGLSGAAARSLGRSHRVAKHEADPRMAIVYDAQQLSLRGLTAVPLATLPSLSFIETLYMEGGRPSQCYALLARFTVRRPRLRAKESPELVVANVHLDAAGSTEHRETQMTTVREALAALARRWRRPAKRPPAVVAAGDTNAFAFSRGEARAALRRILGRLGFADATAAVHGERAATDPRFDTHWFSRAHEPKWGQRIAVAAGAVGIDLPLRCV